ncbi:hypothetical protein Athai_17430 [Actinocatenispora thailandica]|uniref:HTH luxR-type domain-containing protein n=1 Tax=Actinocatenispora thailandica TaxID=227318 RepID=A0A7R7DM44_9ACTN|nr:LuxR family transcriptional regulator [Actinocatenispora thailandica]BCJ34240.1 hypothetical protein Athai_17430 [Actinocatenispora thailandica]
MARTSAVTTPPRLFGRAAELRRLRTALASAAGDRSRAVVVRGASGVGKSSLLAAADLPAAPTVRVCCRHDSADTAFAVARQIIAELGVALRDATGLGIARTVAHPTDPAGPPGPAHPAVAAGRCQRDLLVGLRQHIEERLAETPLVLVVDDVQWCDEASARWLALLSSLPARHPVTLLLGQSRHRTRSTAVVDGMVAEGRCEAMELGPITEAAVGEMLAEAYREPASDRFRRCCAELSGGNPAALERLVGALRACRIRPDDAGAAELRSGAVSSIGPRVFADLLRWPRVRSQVARAIALLGTADADLIGGALRLPSRVAAEATAQLRRDGVLEPAGAGFGQPLLREALVAELSEPTANQLLARAARLMDDAGRPLAEIADLLLRLPRLDERWMLDTVHAAATSAVSAGSPTAVDYLSRLRQERPDQLSIRLELATALLRTDPELALSHLDHASATNRAGGPDHAGATGHASGPDHAGTGHAGGTGHDVRVAARLALCRGWAELVLGRADGGWSALCDAERQLSAATRESATAADAALRVRIRAAVGAIGMMRLGRTRQAWQQLTEPAGPGRRAANGDRLLGVRESVEDELTALRGVLHTLCRGDLDTARRYADGMPRSDRALAGWTGMAGPTLLLLLDEAPGALRLLDRACGVSRRLRQPGAEYVAQLARAVILLQLGRIEDAVDAALVALGTARRCRWRPDTSGPRLVLAGCRLAQGRADLAGRIVAQLPRDVVDDSVWLRGMYASITARLHGRQGDWRAAVAVLDEHGAALRRAGIVDHLLAPWWFEAVTVLADAGRPELAEPYLDRGGALARRWPTPHARGRYLLAASMLAAEPDRLRLARDAADASGERAPVPRLEARLRIGRLLLAEGDRHAARQELRAVLAGAESLGLLELRRAAGTALSAAGGTRPAGADPGPAGSPTGRLTDSERRVAELAAQGLTNRQVAAELFLSTRTVEFHLTNVYRKTGVPDRRRLAAVLTSADARPAAPQRRRPEATGWRSPETSRARVPDGPHRTPPEASQRWLPEA